MEETVFYETSRLKVTNFVIDSEEWTIPISEIRKVWSGSGGKKAFEGSLIGCVTFFTLYLNLQWWIHLIVVIIGGGLSFGLIYSSWRVIIHTQTRPRKHKLLEDVTPTEAQYLKKKVSDSDRCKSKTDSVDKNL